MFVQRIKSSELLGQLNSEAYAPHHIKFAKIIKKSGLDVRQLGDIVSKKINNSIRNISGQLDSNEGKIPMFRPADISNGTLSVETAPLLTEDFESKHEKARVFSGDLVLGIAGSVGVVGRVPQSVKHGNINGSSARITTNSDLKSAYLLAYIQSKYGQSSLLRYCVGSVQKHLNLEDLPSVTIAYPKNNVIIYIGDKVRQAERLRECAKALEQNFNNELIQIYNVAFNGQVDERKYSHVKKDDLSIDLNPGLYNAERLRVRKSISEVSSKKIGDIAIIKAPSSNEYTSSTKFLGLDGISSNNSSLAITTIEKTNVKGTLRYLLSGPIIPKLNPYLNKAAYIPKELEGTVGSPELLCVVPNNKANGWFIYGALKQETTLKQLNPISTGSTHLRVTPDNIRDIVIPWPEDRVKKGKYLEKAFRARQLSSILTTAAKLFVESLIEGKITENQLINAQQSLEKGETALDQSILERLKTDGMDGEGEPLFTDLEQVYELLKQAEDDNHLT
ncbi:Restriction endonuclease domain-containing protein [Desulfonema limicola]|uniref:Restriction endonuclease domain-containing protein n=1 Tax=Desulfonema limicola TaxID=45656 RepID=A0A975GF11_9BACT|nr:restriction endonuclease subunit S [Desulfonema limicola]QTA78690.1 Restriction endonuclease domain-containing protein [Desulfonema limicola]